ncbi:error-prone DNA polymerase [Amnibacterium sp. CER49]|uniref:error-prone DNA polymerase n=1 Tax=Amnibacterium sp. CER49 TaxID=3039161 RepID=UPI00244839D9|nr:error-prone DNA polymerase [Amnibacterium sp. CER49]MDH2444455.1 error-prone DNA polymerase [Amnibacterium sp. CER49]
MAYSNPPIPWSEFERRLSDSRRPGGPPVAADGGDSPAWSLKRHPYRAQDVPPPEPAVDAVPYAELHAHSNFSFLDGASSPEELLEQASRLGLAALALTDHDGFYGSVRLAEAAEQHPVDTVFGAELSLGLGAPQNGVPDPDGSHLLLLARGAAGYHAMAAAMTEAHLAPGAEKGRPVYDEASLVERLAGHVIALTGCRKGRVRQALVAESGLDPAAAARELDRLVDAFGRDAVVVELFDGGAPLDAAANDALFALAGERRLPVVATANAHAASPERRRLASALAAVRARRSLDEMDGWLPAAPSPLRSGAEQRLRFARYPGAVERTLEIAAETRFALKSLKPGLPKVPVPEGHTPMSWLRRLVLDAVPVKYPRASPADLARIDRELAVIEEKDFPGYFLIVHEIVQFAKSRGILCQGRGSAANSAVCYLLGITAVDSIFFDLPFERFLSSLRDEEPDIDVDFDSDRREEVIQHVYERYGRRNAAQVANVITYRPKNAVRDMAKALGASTGQQDAWSRQIERWGGFTQSDDHDIPAPVVDLASQVLTFPRHLGIHSGGMVLTDRPVGEVVPVEHARMEGRTVLQWDKDDCAWMGLVKFDLLGLGMLAALQYAFDLAAEHTGERWTLETIPKEEAGVYDQLCRADTVGVFQVESRAQMGTLPRLQPRRFYDLVIEVALIRPGPIQGGAVHPYVRRRLGDEPVTYLHPLLEPVLSRTLGVPIFQEQLMQTAMAVGGCTGEDADLLRRAMGSKRGIERIESLRDKLYAGMAMNGIDPETADEIYLKIQAFANFGFAESHSLSFALLVYASAWMRLHYPGVFLAALLRAQPMGFYSPASLTADARRHGVQVRRPDINASLADAGLEPLDADRTTESPRTTGLDRHPAAETQDLRRPVGGSDRCLDPEQPPVPPRFDREAPVRDAEHRRDGAFAVRLGLAGVTGIGQALATRIVLEREAAGPYSGLRDLARRVGLSAAQLEALATAGAFSGFGLNQREALWEAGPAAEERPEYLPHTSISVQPPLLPEPTAMDLVAADLWATGISPDDHPLAHVRPDLARRGVLTALQLRSTETGRRIEVGGVVTHRQRPATASGITFLNLEDETGMINVIASVGVWQRYRRVAREAPSMIVRGILERSPEGVVNIVADRFERLVLGVRHASRDFR